jgi:hypothetical protein
MEMPAVFQYLDPYLIGLYRITGHGPVDFLLGTCTLALLALVVGEIASSLAILALRKHLEQATATAARYQDLSVNALMAGDNASYQAANQLANDAFGKSFFMQVALSAGFLWPVCFALAWMQYRFAGLEIRLPFTDHSLGFIGIFILVFIPIYLIFRKVKYRLPYFRRLREHLDACQSKRRGLKTFGDLLAPSPPAKGAYNDTGFPHTQDPFSPERNNGKIN